MVVPDYQEHAAGPTVVGEGCGPIVAHNDCLAGVVETLDENV